MMHAISAQRSAPSLPPQAQGLALGHRRAQAQATEDTPHGPAARVTLSAEGRAMAHQAITAEAGRAHHAHGKSATHGHFGAIRPTQSSGAALSGTGGASDTSGTQTLMQQSDATGRRVPRGIAKKLGAALSGPSSALSMARNLSAGPTGPGTTTPATGTAPQATASHRISGHGRGWGQLINGTQGAAKGQHAEAAAKAKPPHAVGAPTDDMDRRTMREVLQAAAKGVVTDAKLRRTADAEDLAGSAHAAQEAKDREGHRAYAEAPKRRDDAGGLSHPPSARALSQAAAGSTVGQYALSHA